MRPIQETTVLYQNGGTAIASGGTITATGVDWTPTYEPYAKMVVSTGATPSGTLVAHLQQSDVVGSGYTTLGTISSVGDTGGTAVYSAGAAITQRYVRLIATSAGGTVLASTSLIGKPRNPTS